MHSPSAPPPPPSIPFNWRPAPFEERFWQWVTKYQPSNDEPESSPVIHVALTKATPSRHRAMWPRGAEALN